MEMFESEHYVWHRRDRIGQGSFGQVYRGQSKENGKVVAVKVEAERDGQHEEEIKILQRMGSACPYVVTLIGVESQLSDGRRVLILELAQSTLQKELDDPCNHHGLPLPQLLTLIHDLEAALSFLREKHVFHRDLKPSNILIHQKRTGGMQFKLCDFGGARQVRELEDPLQSIRGTVGYASPAMMDRLLAHGRVQDPLVGYKGDEVDLWSVGVVLFQAATGQLPFLPAAGLKDSQAMAIMLRAKPPRAIWGRQIGEGENARYEWRESLPTTAPYPLALCRHIAVLFQGLLERSESLRFTFREFAMKCSELSAARAVVFLDAASARIFHYYPFSAYSLKEDFSDVCGGSIDDRRFISSTGRLLPLNDKTADELARSRRECVLLLHKDDTRDHVPFIPGSGVSLNNDGRDMVARMRVLMASARALIDRVDSTRELLPRALEDLRGSFREWMAGIERHIERVDEKRVLCDCVVRTLEPLRLMKNDLYQREFRGYHDSGLAAKAELSECARQFMKLKEIVKCEGEKLNTIDLAFTTSETDTLKEFEQIWISMQRRRHNDDESITSYDWKRVRLFWSELLADVDVAERHRRRVSAHLQSFSRVAVAIVDGITRTMTALELAESMIVAIDTKNKIAIKRLQETPVDGAAATTHLQFDQLVSSMRMALDESAAFRDQAMNACTAIRDALI